MPDHRAVADVVQRVLREYLADSTVDPLLRKLASDLQALPLYCGWLRCVAIRPSGEIISFDVDSWDGSIEPPGEVRLEDDEISRNKALFLGSKNRPALQLLCPTKPPDAVECPQCGGTGKQPEPLTFFICRCGGLGWLPSNSRLTEE